MNYKLTPESAGADKQLRALLTEVQTLVQFRNYRKAEELLKDCVLLCQHIEQNNRGWGG